MTADDPATTPTATIRSSNPAEALMERLHAWGPTIDAPLFVGLDGRGGSGKSTLAAAISNAACSTAGNSDALTVIKGDQFYAGGSNETWDGRTVAEWANSVIDWRRQRLVLEQLREEGTATWHPFDWDSNDWDSDIVPFTSEPVAARLAPIVVLEGAYSCRPELHDLLDVRVLLDVPQEIRRRQLIEREGDGYRINWEARWDAAEDHYFVTVMRPDRFDFVIGPA
ncbi:MAG: hypothetical protein ABI239_11145 [Aquihabitans sp.]